MSETDINEVNPGDLVNAASITLDAALPQAERAERFLEQIHNPYCFISGGTPVRIRFTGSEKALSASLLQYFSRLKQR
jgi:hypothetical protein